MERNKGIIMNIDFIKWLAGYAKGFNVRFTGTINHEVVEYSHRSQRITCDWHNVEIWFLYPFLLHRAIEGINQVTDIYLIFQDFLGLRMERNAFDGFEKNFSFYDYRSNDMAKEAALKFLWEQYNESNDD